MEYLEQEVLKEFEDGPLTDGHEGDLDLHADQWCAAIWEEESARR